MTEIISEEMSDNTLNADISKFKDDDEEKVQGNEIQEEQNDNKCEEITDNNEESKEESEPSLGSDEWYKRDKEAFDRAYPELDKEVLFSDKAFLSFAEGKVGLESLSQIYSDYSSLIESVRERAIAEAEREFENRLAKAKATPGSLTEMADASDNGYYTLEEMKRMSQAYVEEHWDKVRESLKRINK